MSKDQLVLLDGSRVIIEAFVKSGGEVFIGYPITPSNLLYSYARQRFPMFLPAPDEITALQWMSGISAAGKLAVTATSFPGFALMIETINMAYMMELPLVIVLVQRLGPSTGSATAGAQGDILLLRSCISGGYPVPVFCPSNLKDCWELSYKSLLTAVSLRTPVVLLTSKEMMMTNRSYNISQFPLISPIKIPFYKGTETYKPYLSDSNLVPPFLPLGNKNHQVRINASTHNADGFIRKATPEAMANTQRLNKKIERGFNEAEDNYYLDNEKDSNTLIVTYGITSEAACEAVKIIRSDGRKISLLIIKGLLPISQTILNILEEYDNIIFAEENMTGLLKEILYGQNRSDQIRSVNKIGQMINPSEIVKEIKACKTV